MHELIGSENCGFLAVKNAYDNILAIQETVYSLENDTKFPSMMIIKIDIMKAYDTIEHNTVHTIFFLKWIS